MWQPTAMQCGHFPKRNVTTVWYDMIIIITVPIYRPFSISSKHVYTITFALVCMPSSPFLGASTAKARRVLTIQEEDRANERALQVEVALEWPPRKLCHNGRLHLTTRYKCKWSESERAHVSLGNFDIIRHLESAAKTWKTPNQWNFDIKLACLQCSRCLWFPQNFNSFRSAGFYMLTHTVIYLW